MPTPPSSHQGNGLDAFATRIRQSLAEASSLTVDAILLERPRQELHGEFAFPCFRFAKAAGKNPAELASALASTLQIEDVELTAVGPFLNFSIHPSALAQVVLASTLRDDFGCAQENLTTIVEFSSPNIAKPMHVGHMRTTVIGAALSRIFQRLGHKVIRINHLGDWGSQFGKLVAAWQRWGSEEALEASPIAHLLELYVHFHKEAETDPSLAEEAKRAFQELESGEDNLTRATWKRFTELSLREFQRVYDRFGITFDYVRGESWYENQLQDVLAWLEGCGVLEEDDGAFIIDLSEEGIKTPCLVKTTHGTTLYATRDIAAAKSRWEEFHFDQMLYVVGAEQTLHFQQFKAALKKCGASWQERMEHIPFGLIRLTEGKLSTREGRVISLSEVLDRAVDLAQKAVEEKNPELADKKKVAEMVGVGAVVFHDLKHQRQKDVIFNWQEVLSFEGDTGPYLQYTHARCCSILRKAERPIPSFSAIQPELVQDGRDLFVAMGRLPQAIRDAGQKREPMILAQALLRIGAAGNAFYREHRVLGTGDEELEKARLATIDALRRTLALGLELLGVPVPEEM